MEDKITIVLASRNPGKTREIRELLKGRDVEIKNLDDFGPIPDVVEDGENFDDNAYKKASFTARVLGLPALADDSGLCVDALGGAPGVFSARYAGENATDEENCLKLMEDMRGNSNRKASFQCVISLAIPTGPALTYEGQCEGLLTEEPRGANGFGYDPYFYYPEFGKTFAELSVEEKGAVSHRGKALGEFVEEFDKVAIWVRQNMPKQEMFKCE